MQPIGILGGMGPEASADVYLKIIRLAYRHAAQNMDAYPHILINNLPTPNIFQRPSHETGLYLGEQVRVLERAGARAIGVACNSAHYFWSDMRAALAPGIWLVDMIDEVAGKVQQNGFTRVGVLSSSMSRPLYQQAIANHACLITDLSQSEQEAIDRIIEKVLAGIRTPELQGELRCLAEAQVTRGAQCVVLGCTDLPLILDQSTVLFPLVASNDVLAEALFNFSIR